MPLLVQQNSKLDEQQAKESTHESTLRGLQSSPSFRKFSNSTAVTWVPDRMQSFQPSSPASGVQHGLLAGSFDGPASSDTSMKHTTGPENHQGSSPTASLSYAHVAKASTGSWMKDRNRKSIDAVALDNSLTNTAVSGFPIEAQAHFAMHYPPSPWNGTAPAQDKDHSHSRVSSGAGSGATLVTDYSPTLSVGSGNSNGCMSPGLHRQSRHVLQTPVADEVGSPKDLNVPSGSLYHRRESIRLSSLPAVPSPLGLTHSKNDGSEIGLSALLESLPGSPSRLQSTQSNKGPMKSPAIFGLHAREDAIDKWGNSVPMGISHARTHTDPFIDNAEKYDRSPPLSPYMNRRLKAFEWLPAAPVHTSTPPGFEPISPAVPNNYSCLPPSSHAELLPIPPPPLPSISGKLKHTPEARARLEAQKVIREEWILTEAKKIAELNHLMLAAAQKYQQTGLKEDCEAWQTALESVKDALDIEKRMEERRNLPMPNGMMAMRTGPDNKIEDGSAAYLVTKGGAMTGGEPGNYGEGRLFGYEMAVMERVCAEVKRKDEEDNEITSEMLATLDPEERKALRDHLMGRLEKIKNSNA